jgi:hypothetical protein
MKKLNWIIILLIAILPTSFSVSCKSKKESPKQEDTRNDSAPVIVTPDATLRQSVNNVLAGYPGITADVNDGVVTLKGSIQQVDLSGLIQKIQELRPKKVENQLTIK